MDNEKYSSSSKPKAPEQLPTNNPTRPIIAGSHDEKKPAMASGLTRATPGKSASMRGEKKPNLIKYSFYNLEYYSIDFLIFD